MAAQTHPAPTVLVADKLEKFALNGLKSLGCAVTSIPDLGAERMAGGIAEHKPQVLVVRGTKVSKVAIEAGPNLRLIIRAGAGYDSIDCAAAAARNVAVCNCPGMNSVAVAELAFGMILALDRRLVEQTIDLRAGRWNKKEYSKSRGIKGQTLGVIGLGAIGRALIQRAKAFGMNVWAHSLNMTHDRALDLGVHDGGSSRQALIAMLGECDVVSVHVAANRESDHMCDAEFFAAMRPGAMFINTSRGSVVNEQALLDAIKTKGIRAGLDVFEGEPAGGEAAWSWHGKDQPGIIGSHHVGASTEQAQNAVAEEVVRIVQVFRDTGRFENKVN